MNVLKSQEMNLQGREENTAMATTWNTVGLQKLPSVDHFYPMENDNTVVTVFVFVTISFKAYSKLVNGSYGFQSERHEESTLSKFAMHFLLFYFIIETKIDIAFQKGSRS